MLVFSMTRNVGKQNSEDDLFSLPTAMTTKKKTKKKMKLPINIPMVPVLGKLLSEVIHYILLVSLV